MQYCNVAVITSARESSATVVSQCFRIGQQSKGQPTVDPGPFISTRTNVSRASGKTMYLLIFAQCPCFLRIGGAWLSWVIRLLAE
jgi:hypothetical protein